MSQRRMAWVTTLAVLMLALAVHATEVREITLDTNDLEYDPLSSRIWASVPGRAGAHGNSVTSIQPASGEIGPFVFIGSEPGKLALSDDGKLLYVGLDGAAAVRLFHVPTQTAGLQFDLGNDPFFGPRYPEDLEVQPGHRAVVAVSMQFLGVSPRHAGVAVFDEGIQRVNATPRHTGSNVIEFSLQPDTLFGYNNETTEFGFREMHVDASGVEIVSAMPTAISGFGVDITYHRGVVYSTSGVAIDPETGLLLGTFSGVFFADAVVADADLDRVYFLSDDVIDVFRLSTFTFVEQIQVPGVSGQPSSLVRWGKDGLAFRTDSGQVFLLSESPLVSVEGSCPGPVTVAVSGAPANSEVGLIAAANNNGFTKHGRLCEGTVFEIGEPLALPPTWLVLDANGTGTVQVTLESGRCWLEALSLANCRTSGATLVPDD